MISLICMQVLFVTIMHLCIFYIIFIVIALLIDILSSFSLKHFLIAFLILLSGDVESNPGPNNKQTLSVFHWNLNSISVYNFIKLSSIQALNSIHKFDLLCISETYLDSSISSDNPDLTLDGYKLIRSDHPLDIKRGGALIYYKETLPIKFLNISNLGE